MFEHHGVAAERRGQLLGFPDHQHRLSASVVREREAPDAHAVQLDVRLEVAGAGTLVESFVGLGPGRDEAIADALDYFMHASLHPILAAFFGRSDDRLSVEGWRIGGLQRRVVVGEVAWRGDPPEPAATERWSERVREALERVDLSPGTHWIRVYYAQTDRAPNALEALLDSEPWPEARDALAGIEWPAGPGFFSLRLLLIAQDA